MKGEVVVAESVHLFDDQRFEDLLGAHHPVTARLRVVQPPHEVREDEVRDFRVRVDDMLDGGQLPGVLVIDRRKDYGKLWTNFLSHRVVFALYGAAFRVSSFEVPNDFQ